MSKNSSIVLIGLLISFSVLGNNGKIDEKECGGLTNIYKDKAIEDLSLSLKELYIDLFSAYECRTLSNLSSEMKTELFGINEKIGNYIQPILDSEENNSDPQVIELRKYIETMPVVNNNDSLIKE